MAFTEAQLKNLEAKLDAKHVRTRRAEDTTLAYVEGWHVIAEANRIFGYDAWDRHTLSTRCVWSVSGEPPLCRSLYRQGQNCGQGRRDNHQPGRAVAVVTPRPQRQERPMSGTQSRRN